MQVCNLNPVYCHRITVASHGQVDFDDILKLAGNFVLSLNASFMFCFVLSVRH